jgi:PPIC-type PPIASE domain
MSLSLARWSAASLLALLTCGPLAAAQSSPPSAPRATPAPAQSAPAQSAPAPAPAPSERIGVASLESLARGDDAMVAKVGDVELRRSDAFRILDLAAPARSAEVIRQMVLTTGAQLDAARESIDVPAGLLQHDIDAAIAEQKASFALEVDEHLPLEDYLRLRHGLTPEAYHAEVRRMVLASMLLERAVRLDELRADHDEVELMVVEDEKLAHDLATQLQGGASFAVLAKKNSVHPSAAQGGSLPPVPTAADIPLLDGRKDLKPGDRLGPLPIQVKGKTLWRLLRLVDRVPATTAPWSELREAIERSLADRTLSPDELALFEAHIVDRYGVTRFTRPP